MQKYSLKYKIMRIYKSATKKEGKMSGNLNENKIGETQLLFLTAIEYNCLWSKKMQHCLTAIAL